MQGGNVGHLQHGHGSLHRKILLVCKMIGLSTREQIYDPPEGTPPTQEPPSTSQSSGPLTIEKSNLDIVLHPPKSILCWSTHNANAHFSHNYGIIFYEPITKIAQKCQNKYSTT